MSDDRPLLRWAIHVLASAVCVGLAVVMVANALDSLTRERWVGGGLSMVAVYVLSRVAIDLAADARHRRAGT